MPRVLPLAQNIRVTRAELAVLEKKLDIHGPVDLLLQEYFHTARRLQFLLKLRSKKRSASRKMFQEHQAMQGSFWLTAEGIILERIHAIRCTSQIWWTPARKARAIKILYDALDYIQRPPAWVA